MAIQMNVGARRAVPLLVRPLRRMHFFELERFLVKLRLPADAGELPRRHICKVRVVPQRFALRRLALLTKMTAARLAAVKRVEREQFRELEIVGHPTRVLEALIQIVGRPGHRDGVPELVAQLRYFSEGGSETRLGSRHADVVPQDAPEFAMDFADA